MSNVESTTRRKVGRPSKGGKQDPGMLMRYMHVVWMFQKLRTKGVKFDSAVEETRAYLKEEFGLKKASATMIKAIIAETIPRDADEQWSVEINKDPVTGTERGILRFVSRKSYIRANSPSRNSGK